MGFNNSIGRGSKFVTAVNSRFSELVVRSQFRGLLGNEYVGQSNLFSTKIKTWFEALPGKPDDKPRYKDDTTPGMFWDGKPKRILMSHYKEYKGQDFFAIGMNYGVLIGKTIVEALGGHEYVSRILACHGLVGVWNATHKLPENVRQIIGSEIELLNQAISMEQREEL